MNHYKVDEALEEAVCDTTCEAIAFAMGDSVYYLTGDMLKDAVQGAVDYAISAPVHNVLTDIIGGDDVR